MKPQATFCVSGSKAVVVEWFGRKPCCGAEIGRELSSGRRSRSRTLAVGQRREMGRYPDPAPGWSSGARIAAIADGPGDKFGGERGRVVVKRTSLVEKPLNAAGMRISRVWDCGSELFIKCFGYFKWFR